MTVMDTLPTFRSDRQSLYVVDDHEVVRRGLRQLVSVEGLEVSGEAGAAGEAIRRIPALRPGLVILDSDLPDGPGVKVCRAITAVDPSIRCVVLADRADETVLIDAVLAGAWGCLSKQDNGDEQLRLIRRAVSGHTAYSPRFRSVLAGVGAGRGSGAGGEQLLRLSPQEMRVALGVGEGLSNFQIGQEMVLSEKTVKNLVSSILMKLGMRRRTQVAVYVATTLAEWRNQKFNPYRFSPFPDLVVEVVVSLEKCVAEDSGAPLTEVERARDAARVADALDAAYESLRFRRS